MSSSYHRPRRRSNHPSDQQNSGKPVFVGTRIVGTVRGDTFHKRVLRSKHLLHKPQGWASDLGALQSAAAEGARFIEVFDQERGEVFRTSIDRMLQYGVRFNRGFGLQVALPIDAWDRPDLGEQLDLFAAVGR